MLCNEYFFINKIIPDVFIFISKLCNSFKYFHFLEKKKEEEAFEQSINPDLQEKRIKFPGLSIPDEAPMHFDITDYNVCK